MSHETRAPMRKQAELNEARSAVTQNPTLEMSSIEEIGPTKKGNRDWLIRLISILAILGTWEWAGHYVAAIFLPYPSAVAAAAARMLLNGELVAALLESLETLLSGFLFASVLGIVLGLLIGRYRTFEVATDWLVNALYATPLVAVVPLIVLWCGLGFKAKFLIVVVITIFPVLINTAGGVSNISSSLIDVGTAFGATERQTFLKILLPAALPSIVTGLRLGIGKSIIAIVVAEFFTAITGLGALVVKYGNQYDTASMFVPILVLMLLGIGLTSAVRRIEEWIAPWKHSDEE